MRWLGNLIEITSLPLSFRLYLLSDGSCPYSPDARLRVSENLVMEPAQGNRSRSSGVERDRALVPVLQDISRRLDMNASAEISAVRSALKSLLQQGKLNPPATGVAQPEELSVSEALRRIAQEEGLASSHDVLDRLPARKITKGVRRQQKAKAPEAQPLEEMTTPQLSEYLSQEIKFHTAFHDPRQKKAK